MRYWDKSNSLYEPHKNRWGWLLCELLGMVKIELLFLWLSDELLNLNVLLSDICGFWNKPSLWCWNRWTRCSLNFFVRVMHIYICELCHIMLDNEWLVTCCHSVQKSKPDFKVKIFIMDLIKYLSFTHSDYNIDCRHYNVCWLSATNDADVDDLCQVSVPMKAMRGGPCGPFDPICTPEKLQNLKAKDASRWN